MYANVALLSPPYACLTYLFPPEFPLSFWKPGMRVAVPLGRGGRDSLRTAVLLGDMAEANLPEGVACKEICWPLDGSPLIGSALLSMVLDLARRQGLTPGYIFGHVLPVGLRSVQARLHWLRDGRTRVFDMRGIRHADWEQRRAMARALCNGEARMLPRGTDLAEEEVCILRVDPPWPVRPRAARQIAVLEYLHEHGSVSRRLLLRALGQASARALEQLVGFGHVALVRGEGEQDGNAELLQPLCPRFELNGEQDAALRDLCAAVDSSAAGTRLLYGVTGSGKTAVYLELARHCLSRGKSLLLLAPEVALAHKLLREAKHAIPRGEIFFHHGYQSPARRERTFRELASLRGPCIVVGTRSALFLPIPLLGCVILDEEHDASFKQDEGFSYQAKEVAWFLMDRSAGVLVLGSATPDIKTFHAAQTGTLPVLRLPHRVSGHPLPPVELVDISRTGKGGLAPQSESALREILAAGGQAVVLLNRRGYAPSLYCPGCNMSLRCPHCAIGLTYHKKLERLICHYCGYVLPFPSPCPTCGGTNYVPLGEGTERLAEDLSVLAKQPVLRLDRDSVRRPGRMEAILEAFARQESPILVGTQMLSKGHHFPNVTLVIVADADLGLNLPDYRAAERTFQLLVQSAGRAGRGEKRGRVLLQTREMGHYCWQYVAASDYEGFYAAELERRRKRRYPPFVRLGLLRISCNREDALADGALQELAKRMRAQARMLAVQILGPAPAPIPLLRGNRRFHCLLKGDAWSSLRRLFLFARQQDAARHLRLSLDLDPMNMM